MECARSLAAIQRGCHPSSANLEVLERLGAWASDRIELLAWEGEFRTVPTTSIHSPTLTLLKGEGQKSPHGLAPLPPSEGDWETQELKRALPRRPGDNFELLVFEATDTLQELRRAARDSGLNPDTAVSLVCERRLALADLAELGLAELEPAVNEAAAVSRRRLGMWEPESAYLRHLRNGDSNEAESKTPIGTPRASVPIRLIGRLGQEEVLRLPLGVDELADAVEWEVASILSGRLLIEWAVHTALAALMQETAST
jgi:hypothetical protein